jgi:hypothetical protein
MRTNLTSLNHLCFPAAVLLLLASPACGGDDSDDDGASTATDDTSGTASDPTGNDPTGDDDPTGNDPTGNDSSDGEGSSTGDDAGSTTDPDTSGGEAVAQVRVMHLGVNAPGVDVFANGEGPVFSALEFRSSTAYAEVPPGDYTFQVSVSGSGPDEAVLAPELTLEAGMFYTAVAIGDLEMTDGAPELQAIALVDDPTGIGAGDVRITVVHAAPAVGQVDLWEVSDPENPVPLLEDVDFGVSATLPDLPAGPIQVGVDIDDDAQPDVVFSVDTTPLAGGQINAYANNDGDGNVALVAQLADGTVLPIQPD